MWLIILFVNSSSNVEEVTTLHVLLPAFQVESLKELITDFNKENSKIFIKMTEASNATNLVEDVYLKPNNHSENPVYDLIFMDIIWVAELAKKGVLLNLSPMMSKEEFNELKEDFLPKDWKGGLYQNNLYRIPFRSDVSVIYYRKDLLKELKVERPPKTFEELKEIANEWYTRKSFPSYLWQGNEYEGLVTVFVEVLEGYGGFWINENLDVGLEENAALTAVKFLHDTIKNKISPSDVTYFREKDTTSEFEKGKAVFLRSWVYWPETDETGSKIQNKLDFVPMVNDKKHKGGSCQGGWGFGIAKKSNNKEEAWTAIKFLTSVSTQKKYALKNGYMPSRRSLLNDLQLVKRYSYYPRLLEISGNSILRPQLTNYSDVSKILQEHLSSILKNQKITPEEVKTEMTKAAKKTRQELQSIAKQ